jgi:hypothetical protein
MATFKGQITNQLLNENEQEAKEKAKEFFTKNRFFKSSKITIEDDSYNIHGVLNMDETWNML